MGKTVILVVEPDTDDSATQEIRKRYGEDYQVVREPGFAEAQRSLIELGERIQEVALVVTQANLGEASGLELLAWSRSVCPTAKRVLLMGWADAEMSSQVRDAMAQGQVHYALPKPSIMLDERFHVTLTEFLAEWTRSHRPQTQMVRVVGPSLSARSLELRDLLQRYGIPYRFHASDSPEGAAFLREAGIESQDHVIVALMTGQVLVNASNTELADALGGSSDTLEELFDVLVIGAGPAGLAAAVSGASEGLRTLVLEREAIGGQAGTSSLVRNYPGFPLGVSGSALAAKAYEQAWLFGAKFHFMRSATQLRPSGDKVTVTLSDGSQVAARAVVIATGVSYRRLGVAALEDLIGRGVYYGAPMSESAAVRGKRVFVVGGGNSAGQAALHLAKYASHVTLVVRGADLAGSMSDYLRKETAAAANISVRLRAEVVDGTGGTQLEALTIKDLDSGKAEKVESDGLFVLIGAAPHTDWLRGYVACDSHGFILTGNDLESGWPLSRPPLPFETSMPNVFAVGDVRHNSTKRVASAVGEGSVVVSMLLQQLSRR